MVPTVLSSLEEMPLEESYSSVASLEEWYVDAESSNPPSPIQQEETKQSLNAAHCTTNTSSTDVCRKKSCDSDCFELDRVPRAMIRPVGASREKPLRPMESAPKGKGGHRVMDSFASVGARDSSKSLHGCLKTGPQDDREEDSFWIKVDLVVPLQGQEAKLAFMLLEGQTMKLYLLEKAREEQFHARNERSHNKESQTSNKVLLSSDDLDDVPLYHDEWVITENNSHSQLARRRRACTAEGKVPGLLKSVSMTTLLTAEALEPIDPVREETAAGYNMDGQCIQQFFGKRVASEPEFGFACPRDSHSIRQSASSASPKKRRSIHQSFKSKWQPVGRAFARCCAWEAASSVDSSSRRMFFSPCGCIKRFVCCASSCSSDDETVRGY